MDYGLLCFIPPVFIIFFAVITRRSFSALMLGALLAYIIMEGTGFYGPFMDCVYGVLKDGDTQWTIMITGFFGVMIALFQKSRGIEAFTSIVAKVAVNARKTMLMAWIMGLIIFIGDMLNNMAVGGTMRKLTDKYKIPREMLAYIMDSTAAPVAVLAPVSSWAAFFISVFMKQPEVSFVDTSKVANYASLTPMLFYPMATVVCVFLLCMGILPKLGTMKTAFLRAEAGKPYSDQSRQYNLEEAEEDPVEKNHGNVIQPRLYNFLLPVAVLIYISVAQGDVFKGAVFGIATCVLLYLGARIMIIRELTHTAMERFTGMIPMIIIIVGAFMARDALNTMGLPNYVVSLVQPYMSAGLLPAITFLVVAALAFVTSSSWGIPAIMVPIVIPLAAATGASIPLTLAAIVSAASFGAHACFYADVTVITSSVAKLDNMEHALSQIPYATLAAGVALPGYILGGFAMI